jgi:Ala-tRNA(Pro) deacylase
MRRRDYNAARRIPGSQFRRVAGRFAGAGGSMRPRSVDDFLRKLRIPYTTLLHPPAFTAQHAAAVSHVPGRCFAKTVVCFADSEPIFAVVPAHHTVELDQLRQLTGAETLRLAQPHEMAALYPDCEEGTMPPFGDLYVQRVFVDETLVGEPEMVFSAGTHTDCLKMHFGDFAEVAHPVVGRIGRPRHES